MKHLILFLCLLSAPLFAAQPLLEVTFYKDTTQTGYIRQMCSSKAEAQTLLAKYVDAYGKDQSVYAQLHTCDHDLAQTRGCVIEVLQGTKPALATLEISKETTTTVALKTPINKPTADNPVMFVVPVTKDNEASLVSKIKAEEFAGKEVVETKATAAK